MAPLARIPALFAHLPGPVRAGVWMTCASAGFIGMMAVARILAPELHIFVIVFFRSVFGFMFMLPWLVRKGPGVLRTTRTRLFLLRSASAFVGLTFFFTAATLIPLADIAAIGFTRPIFACLAAMAFLGEAARLRRWVAIAAGFAGALLIVRPGFAEINPGTLFAFGAVAVQVVNAVVIKSLSRTEPPDTIAIYQGIYLAPLALAAAAFVWTTPDAVQLLWLLLMGALGTLTQRTLARAYAAADASVVAALDFLRLPTAALIGLVVFAEFPDQRVWIGGAIIVASSILLTRREAADRTANRPR